MEPTAPQQAEEPNSSPKPFKKSFVSSLLEAATLRSPSFKEDIYFVSHLKSSERNALQDLKSKLPAALNPPSSASIWGIPLLSDHDDRADVVLLKFLRARDFRVPDALSMLQKCLAWRREFGADGVCDKELGFKELEGVVAYMHAHDREGHPVCYNAYGVFKDREVYERVFGDEEKLKRFLQWRVQVLERGIKVLQFKPGGINSIIQVTDLKDMPKRELRDASNQILSLFQDNYPEMVARKFSARCGILNSLPHCSSAVVIAAAELNEKTKLAFIRRGWIRETEGSFGNPFLTQRTKSKFVIAREGNVAETLYKFIRPENVPVQYGGLSRPDDQQAGPPKPASEFTVKGGEKVNLEIDGIEGGATITWDLVVGGWDLDCSAEFVPSAEGSYTISIEKSRRMAPNEEPVHNSYTSKETGKLVLSIDNTASRRRKVAAYRYFVALLRYFLKIVAGRSIDGCKGATSLEVPIAIDW
ncbi:Patellin-6 [Asimina triloba]